MEVLNFLSTAFQSIIKNKMRSLLTMLGIIIGIGSVIVMVSIGEGAQKQISDQISSLGVNLLTVFPEAARQNGANQGGGSGSRLTFDDVDKLKAEGTLISGVSPVLRGGVQAIGGSGNWSTSAYGVSPDYLTIREWTVSDGDNFSDSDVKAGAKVCILGQTVASNLYGDASPVGQTIRLQKTPFRIIGVLSKKGTTGFGQDQDDLILTPYTTFQNRLTRNRFLQQILVSSISKDQMDAAQTEVENILRESHKIPDGADLDFSVRNQADVIATASQTTGVLTAFLASIAGISLIVGGIGIMNIMLVSVTERTREIGIRMAVGARQNDILMQFLIEAVVLCLTGGLMGITLGLGLALIIQTFAGWTVVFKLQTVLLSFGFSLLVGVFFGFYPAKRASELNPIEALRYE